jgi:hypothetical protein
MRGTEASWVVANELMRSDPPDYHPTRALVDIAAWLRELKLERYEEPVGPSRRLPISHDGGCRLDLR